MKYFITILFIAFQTILLAQKANTDIKKGNDAYRKGDYDAAIESYKNALRQEPENSMARFNLANAMQRAKQTTAAEKNYDDVIAKAGLNSLKAASNYNKGLAYVSEKDLPNAVTSFEASLKENPADDDARENLQKALNELKQKQKSRPQPQNQNQKNPKPQKESPLNKQMMEQKFTELRNQEKQLQKKLQSKNNTQQPEKDW